MGGCPIHGYQGVVLACRHLAGRHPDRDTTLPMIKVDIGQSGLDTEHYWCEQCVPVQLSTRDWDDSTWRAAYRQHTRKLSPVCRVCLEWLVA